MGCFSLDTQTLQFATCRVVAMMQNRNGAATARGGNRPGAVARIGRTVGPNRDGKPCRPVIGNHGGQPWQQT